jgi:hypothetical protein
MSRNTQTRKEETMTPKKLMTLTFTLAAFAASGSFLSACAGAPNGEGMVTYRETDTEESAPSTDDAPAACTTEDECQSDGDCATGSFCNSEECVCQELN